MTNVRIAAAHLWIRIARATFFAGLTAATLSIRSFSFMNVDKRKVALIIVGLIIFSISPIVWFAHLPLVDYPNHLARLHIHQNLPTDPNLSRFFQFHWIFTPYLGLDLLAAPFL